MADADRLTEQNDGTQQEAEAAPGHSAAVVSRREFLGGAMVVAGVAMSGLPWPSGAEAQSCTPAPTGEDLLDLVTNALGDPNSGLRGTVRATNERRVLTQLDSTGAKVCSNPMLRYFEGWDAAGNKIWPPAARKGLPTPGPTLVSRVGKPVQLTFLNNVDPRAFPGTIDTGHFPKSDPASGCDVSANNNPPAYPAGSPPPPPDPRWLPSADTYPNCLHGSNASNLHFHGTHVTPSGFGDNVFVMVEADPTMKPGDYSAAFNTIFGNCDKFAFGPVDWKTAVPKDWQDKQDDLLQKYDANMQFRGQRGLPAEVSLFNQNQNALKQNEWPPYQMGAFPNCFTPPLVGDPRTPVKMGQAPGTHWYHAHKHGSTATHLFHGLAGALIIRGKYDDDLNAYYRRVGFSLSEKVMVIQEYAELPPLYRNGGPRAILVNGQFQPTVTMRKGEVQLWRIVNATQGTPVPLTFPAEFGGQFKQIAQDGVQFSYQNYDLQPFSQSLQQASFGPFFPGNRMDLLVRAPSGSCQVVYPAGGSNVVLLNIKVIDGDGRTMPFLPGGPQYPIVFPPFLDDVVSPIPPPDRIRNTKTITFDWDPSKGGNPAFGGTGRNPKGNAPPHFMIDGKQFDPEVVNHTMELDSVAEWTVMNTTNIAHPFHIHVNPFQLLEVFDPTKTPQLRVLPRPWTWWDNFAIPANGWFKMRTRFADFTGKYVLHCHILGHEDRGMMQAVQVIPKPRLNVPHH